MVVDKYYTVIGLSGAQIVMNGTISTSRGVSFFNRILSTSAQRPRDEPWDGTAKGGRESTEYLPTIIIAACVMYHVILQATMVAHTHTHTYTHTHTHGRARARAYKYTYEISRRLTFVRETIQVSRRSRREDSSLHKLALRLRWTLSI